MAPKRQKRIMQAFSVWSHAIFISILVTIVNARFQPRVSFNLAFVATVHVVPVAGLSAGCSAGSSPGIMKYMNWASSIREVQNSWKSVLQDLDEASAKPATTLGDSWSELTAI